MPILYPKLIKAEVAQQFRLGHKIDEHVPLLQVRLTSSYVLKGS